MSNCFLATKVSFMNEMKIIADYNKINWDEAVKGFAADKRIGNSHTSVPGPDGKIISEELTVSFNELFDSSGFLS